MVDRVDCVVIGAGVVGLGVARRLALAGAEIVVLEAAEAIGTETSSRNSEIIHAGIYYTTGSLKARYCVAGKHALYDYCESHGVEHRRCGKFIVATSDDQIPELERLQKVAAANGVPDLEWRTPEEVAEEEPAVFCVGALWSPSTGIIDSHGPDARPTRAMRRRPERWWHFILRLWGARSKLTALCSLLAATMR